LIVRFKPDGKVAGPGFVVSRRNVCLQVTLGMTMLACTLIFPKYCFWMTWLFAYFVTDPICYWVRRKEKNHVGRSLLGQMAAGDYTRLVALCVGGVVCGVLWEIWNLGARNKWIYTIPFFDELKIGELPVLGFFAYPPFALECYAMANILSLLRDGRNWELNPQENCGRRGMTGWSLVACVVLFQFPFLISHIVGNQPPFGSSWSEPIDRVFSQELGPAGVRALQEKKAVQGNLFLQLKERPPEIEPALYERMCRIARLSEIKGMGFRNALMLEKLDIMQIEDLAAQDPAQLTQKLNQLNPRTRFEVVKIWILAARHK